MAPSVTLAAARRLAARLVQATLGAWLVLAALVPADALACPSCALRENTPGRMLVLVGMILLPFGVVAGSLLMIRRMTRSEDAAGSDDLGGSGSF